MASDWQIGDLAVKVAGPCNFIPKGAVCRVVGIHPPHMHIEENDFGLVLEGWHDPNPDFCSCFTASNFRKIRPDAHEACEEEFVTLLKRKNSKVSA